VVSWAHKACREQTHFLFESDTALTTKRLNSLLEELELIVNDALSGDEEPCDIIEQSFARRIQNEHLAWLYYSKKVPVKWATGWGAPKDLENHLVVMVKRSLIGIVRRQEVSSQ
jgi:hypothetical protein